MKITKILYILSILIFIVSILFSGCGSDKFDGKSQTDSTVQNNSQVSTEDKTGQKESSLESGTSQESSANSGSTVAPQSTKPEIDIASVKPNEAGKIMVVMFHNFVDTYKKGDKKFTTTFNDFRNLLQTLYSSDYRLISLNDYLNNKIDVPAGCIPMVFTFDDGTSGQFNLLEENGGLAANRQSAVGIMEEFNKLHPDFGLKATFFVNLGDLTFSGKGTLADRLKYLIDRGFEIGNHTYTHIYLNKVKSADEIQKEIVNAVNAMDNGTIAVKGGIDMVNQAGKSFGEILEDINYIASQMQDVSAVTEEIGVGTHNMIGAIENVAKISTESTENAENVVAASQEQTALMKEVANAAESLTEMAMELQNLMVTFKL